MKEYDHLKLEKKWQAVWDKKKVYQASDKSKKPKYYSLIEFPYPSGAGLHVGHIRSNTAMDIISRKRRMEGFNVLYPIGWDAFGLPTENYAIKTGIHPIQVTKQNTDTFRRQLKSLGFSFDWSREINTTDPKYYKWTQWIFLQFFKKDLAYKSKMTINWCPKDKIGLANEEVINGCCERCGTLVEKREKEQWMLAITKYADRLDQDLDTVDYLSKIKIQQRNWIGKSEGLIFSAKVKDSDIVIKNFSAHFEGCYADTFFVIAPDHPLLPKLLEGRKEKDTVLKKSQEILDKKTKFGDEYKEIDGIFTGRYAIDPLGNGDLPIWVASFALKDYGTGIVKCSAHDERDFAFAKKFNITLKEVIEPLFIQKGGTDGVKADLPMYERNAVICIIKHWEEDKYLCLKWKKNNWHGFVCGGIEGNENPVEAALREIEEETGYTSAKFIKQIGMKVHTQFFHEIKKENRFAHFTPLYFELQNSNIHDINQEEKDLHEIHFISKNQVKDFINTNEDMKYVWEVLQGIEKPILSGILSEPSKFAGREIHEAREDIATWLVEKGFAERKTTYKLRDWIFSRQRYWGEPIPLINCSSCGFVPVPDKDLPVVLPKVAKYKPTDDGESPLSLIKSWVNVTCPKCKGKAKRETDTMPNWAGSSWYFLRYIDPKNKKEFASKKNLKYWMKNGVDWYNGGMEHTTLHLLYSRFWHKFLYDLGLVPTSEPYMKRTSHGLILADDGTKFSKTKGNGINPEDLVKIYGADTLRMYEMFMGPFDQSVSWSTDSLVGPRRFLERVWNLQYKVDKKKKYSEFEIEKTIKKVGEDIESMKFNTAVSTMMIFLNEIEKLEAVSLNAYEKFLKILSPFAPHITEEIWNAFGHKTLLVLEKWPKADSNKMKESEVKIVVQINGKVRAELIIETGEEDESIKAKALKNEAVVKYTAGQNIKKIIYVKNRLINIVL